MAKATFYKHSSLNNANKKKRCSLSNTNEQRYSFQSHKPVSKQQVVFSCHNGCWQGKKQILPPSVMSCEKVLPLMGNMAVNLFE